jgi:dTDP-4-amino-4,6-dideoxygalactose transaminase
VSPEAKLQGAATAENLEADGILEETPVPLRYPIVRPSLPPVEAVAARMARIWASGRVTSGGCVREFEEAVAGTLGVRHAVAVSSCTSGLILAARALGLTGEAIVPAFTFAATAHALIWNGVAPVFCDAEPGTLNLDPARVEEAITERTSAILPVSIFGVPPNVDGFERLARRRGLRLLFDSAQALGARVDGRHLGGFGNAEVFSLSPTKVVTAVEGGMVTTNDDGLAEKIRRMRDYGKGACGEDMEFIGLSARMSELHAAVGLSNLERMTALIRWRGRLVARYKVLLSDLPGVRFQEIPSGVSPSHNYMVIFVDGSGGVTRDALHARLKDEGIETKRYFHPAVHEMTAYREWGRPFAGKLPVAERAAREGLALPLYGDMRLADVDGICSRIRAAFAKNHPTGGNVSPAGTSAPA